MSLRTLLGVVKRKRFISPSEEQMKIRRTIADRLEEDIEEIHQKGFFDYSEKYPKRFDSVIGRITWFHSIFTGSAKFLFKSVENHQKEQAQKSLDDFRRDLRMVFLDHIPKISFCDVDYYLKNVLNHKKLEANHKIIFENHVCQMMNQFAQLLRNRDVWFAEHIIVNLQKSTQV